MPWTVPALAKLLHPLLGFVWSETFVDIKAAGTKLVINNVMNRSVTKIVVLVVLWFFTMITSIAINGRSI